MRIVQNGRPPVDAGPSPPHIGWMPIIVPSTDRTRGNLSQIADLQRHRR
jgi:hypothetical protein